jgi:NitT/TauT family transport system permease protein
VSPTQGVEERSAFRCHRRGDQGGGSEPECAPGRPRLPLFTLPVVTGAALALHYFVLAQGVPPADAQSYSVFLGILAGLFTLLAAGALVVRRVRSWMEELGPILIAALALLTLWEVVTAGLHMLPMPYFPAPPSVVQSLINDRDLLFDSTWHSLVLLLSGYALGVATGLITGICIGWSVRVRYWGMPVLKVLGPIPATAWIPFAMVVSPQLDHGRVRLDRPGRVVPRLDAHRVGRGQHAASYPRRRAHAWSGRPYLVFRVAIPPRCRTSSSACSWVWAPRS